VISPGTARSSVCEGTTGWRAAGTVQEVSSYRAHRALAL